MKIPQATDCITWSNAFKGAMAGVVLFLGHMAWAENTYADADDVREIKSILVKCLIEKRC